MKVTQAPFFTALIRMCDDARKEGWHECHGGNLSYRLSADDAAAVSEELTPAGGWQPIGLSVPGLAGEILLVTAAGQLFRSTAREPERSLGILEISEDGACYRVLWGYWDRGRPTSELPAHLANHEVIKRRSGGRLRLVYHAHPENLIALSFVLPLDETVFTRELWEMMPECAMIFPAGIGVVPWMVPGTPEIAAMTMEKVEEYDIVLWAQHGVFAVGESPDACFGLVETAEKAAAILLKVLSCVSRKRQAPSAQDLRDMAAVFRLPLKEKFLYDRLPPDEPHRSV